MPRTEFLQIRITPEDRERFRRVADNEHLDLSTWARRVLLQAADRWDTREAPRRRVAEPAPESAKERRRK
jgi:hypothetical protein